MEIEVNPNDENTKTRQIPFTKELYIEADDFAQEPPSKFFRLKPGGKVGLYEPLIDGEFDESAEDILTVIKKDTKHILNGCLDEKDIDATPSKTYQFMRNGYFCADYDSTDEKPVFNLTVLLRDSKKQEYMKTGG